MSNNFDSDKTITSIKRFLTGKLSLSGLNGYVVGLSGGIDSALAASLAVSAVGKEKILAVLMPYKSSSEDSVTNAMELVKMLGIDYRKIDISPMIDTYFQGINKENRIRAGNKMARERMSILFDISYETKRLVLGTGNRTEICLGYTTWYGDSACSINPIGELYKSEVRLLSKKLGVPEAILNKRPSADLWVNQTDEDEIGLTYETIDALLKRLVDDNVRSLDILVKEGYHPVDVSRVISLMNLNAFKRRLPDIAPVGKLPIPDRIEIKE